jgi:multiple sugar transport system substrate-binding protein
MSEEKKVSRRRYLKYAGGAAVAVAVAGIGYGVYEATRPPPPPPEKQKLQIWHTCTAAELSLLQEQIADYEKNRPSVEFGFRQISYDDRADDIISTLRHEFHYSPPELYLTDPPVQFQVGKLGDALELDSYLQGWDGLTDIPKSMWNACSYNGKIIAIPQDFFVPVIFYNKDLLSQAGVEKFPDTWDGLLETCKALNNPDKGEHAVGWAWSRDAVYWSIEGFLLSNGGGIYKDGQVILNSAESVEAAEFVAELAKYSAPNMSTWAYEDWDNAFTSGKLAIQLGNGSWNIRSYANVAPNLNYGIAPYPKATRTGGMIVPGHRVRFLMPLQRFLMIGEKFPLQTYVNEAIEFVKYLLSKEQQLRWCKGLNYMPVRSSVLEDPFFNQRLYDAFKYEYENAYAEFPGDLGNAYDSIVQSYAKAYQAILVSKQLAKQALDEATAEIEQTIKS